jgi:hypothetical protein
MGGHRVAVGGESGPVLLALAVATGDVPGSVTRAVLDRIVLPLLSSNRVSRLMRRCGPPALSHGSQKL